MPEAGAPLNANVRGHEVDEPAIEVKMNIPKSLLGLVLAVAVFLVIWVVGAFLFTLLDHIRGIGNDKLQAVFREIVVPGIAGFAAMAVVQSWIESASHRFVFFGFSAIILIVIGAYLGLVGPIAGKIGVGFWDILVSLSLRSPLQSSALT